MTVTVTNLSFEKKKKERGEKSTLFYSGGAQPENSILRQQWRGKYLSKDQRWQSETHYKTMADCLPAWMAVRSRGAAMSCHAVICQGREKETETHIIISLLIARKGESNPACRRISHDPPLQSVACDVVPLHDNNMDVDAGMTVRDIKVSVGFDHHIESVCRYRNG